MQIQEITKKQKNRFTPEKYDEEIKKLRKAYDRPVKGLFEFVDAQGGWLEFNHRIFSGQPILKIRINHGEIVELPAGIVKELRNTKKKIRKYNNVELPVNGIPNSYEVVSRIAFTPVDM